MEKDYKAYGYFAVLIFLALGLYFLGHAGANWLNSMDERVTTSLASGELLSMRNTASIQLILGGVGTFISIILFLVLIKSKVP